MSSRDLESFVTLKFFPPRDTMEYANTIPTEVISKFLDVNFRSQTSACQWFVEYIQSYGLRAFILDEWLSLKIHLVEYYSKEDHV